MSLVSFVSLNYESKFKKKKKKKHFSAQWRRGEGCREITKSEGGRDWNTYGRREQKKNYISETDGE